MILRLLMLSAIIFLSIGDIDQNNSTTYRSLIDGYHGFSKVVIAEIGDIPSYENYTLNISTGDKIIWINDDPTDILTIISEQKLWKDGEVVLGHEGSQFNYIFNSSGAFTFYIKQYQGLSKQTVIVSGTDISTPMPTYTGADIPTPTPNEAHIPDSPPIPTDIDTPVPRYTDIPVPTYTVETNPIMNDTANTPTDMEHIENAILTNPILMPLDILKNIKITIMITFVIIATLSFLIKDGEEE